MTSDPSPATTSTRGAWSLWLAIGYGIVLLCAALALATGNPALEDRLDATRWFR
jgi:hypothetical protein